jgi:hypothetical protein
MGYYVSLTDTNATITADKLDEAYELLCGLNQHNHLKRGGVGGYTYGNTPEGETPIEGPHDKVWFSWLDWNYPDIYPDAKSILEQVGFTVYDIDGDLVFSDYDNKTGCEQDFLDVLAPVLSTTDNRSPQFVWRGENGEFWRQIVTHGEMVTQKGTITFDE